MHRFQTVIDQKPPAAGGHFARRQRVQTILNASLFVAAFLFVTAVVCGIFP